MQRKLTKTKVYYKLFTPSEKETSSKPLKVAAAKKNVKPGCQVWIQLASINVFYSM